MRRLHAELQRLFALDLSAAAAPPPDGDGGSDGPVLLTVDPAAGLRLMVLTLARPAGWPRLQAVWQAVQDELELPAPAIAVDGHDGFQLWFALARPVPAAQAAAFLDGLRQRYLADVAPHRLHGLPAADAVAAAQAGGAPPPALTLALPGGRTGPEQWSAFVAPDLAPVFAETPWLDLPPPQDGQAELLARLQPASAEAFERACASLLPVAPEPAPTAAPAPAFTPAPAPAQDPGPPHPGASADPAPPVRACGDARRFLQRVMDDERVDLRLRIQAATALLAHPPAPGQP